MSEPVEADSLLMKFHRHDSDDEKDHCILKVHDTSITTCHAFFPTAWIWVYRALHIPSIIIRRPKMFAGWVKGEVAIPVSHTQGN